MYTQYARTAADIVREAGQFLKHFSDGHRLRVENKGSDFDFVTNADRESQALIARSLREAFPGHRFVGEEDGMPDAAIAQMLAAGGEDDYFWICDPLDGTVNYIHHLGVYAVSVGLVHRGQSVAGAICLPETGEVFHAARGAGAFLNGRPIRTSGCDSLHRAYVVSDMPVVDMDMRRRYVGWSGSVAMRASNLRMLGSACSAIAMAACGRIDAYWDMGVHPWDVAAGIVLLEEAGGVVTDIFSRPFHFDMTGGFLGCAPGLRGAFAGVIREDVP